MKITQRDYLAKKSPQRRRRQVVSSPPTPAPPVGLVLVAAVYEEATWVRLTFDRAIDVTGLIGSAITVDDGDLSGVRWQATGPSVTMINPTTVRIELTEFDPFAGAGIQLDATSANGIGAVDDGGMWGGVTDVELPFP